MKERFCKCGKPLERYKSKCIDCVKNKQRRAYHEAYYQKHKKVQLTWRDKTCKTCLFLNTDLMICMHNGPERAKRKIALMDTCFCHVTIRSKTYMDMFAGTPEAQATIRIYVEGS